MNKTVVWDRVGVYARASDLVWATLLDSVSSMVLTGSRHDSGGRLREVAGLGAFSVQYPNLGKSWGMGIGVREMGGGQPDWKILSQA